MTDVELVDRVLSGQKDDFALLIQRYQNHIFGTIFRILHDTNDTQDAAQEVFLKAYRALPSFQRGSSFSTWLYRITVNHCLDVDRKRRKFAPLLHEEQLVSHEDTPEQAFLRQETFKEIALAVQSLPVEARSVVALRLYAELPFETIGEILSVSTQTAKMRFFRARQLLKQGLERQGVAPNLGREAYHELPMVHE